MRRHANFRLRQRPGGLLEQALPLPVGAGDALLAAASTNGAQLLVETHSGRLLHRIQRRIAEGHAAKDEVAVHFIEARQGKTEIQELVIDEYGNITIWPKGFFDDEMERDYGLLQEESERVGDRGGKFVFKFEKVAR
jgi:predicted ATPase